MNDGYWDHIRLVVFDVDGTLYRQKPLRLTMLKLLVGDAIRTRSAQTFRVLADYRRTREHYADARVADFDDKLIAEVAGRAGVDPEIVAGLVEDWIDTRPLAFLRSAMVAGVDDVFARLRTSGRTIGVFSDYPAVRKLAALGLTADHVVAARDVGIMKPDPSGLQAVMAAAGATPAETVMIGDRVERDVAAAQGCGVKALLRSAAPVSGQRCFADFHDPIFAALPGRPAH